MAEREDIPSEGLVTQPPVDQDWEPDDTWPPIQRRQPGDDGWEWVEPPYDAPAQPVTPPALPWYRRPGMLVGLIITAMVALVTASVMLLTNARFGETDDVRLRPTIETSAVPVGPHQSPAEPSPSETPTEPSPSSSASEEPGPVGEPEPPAPSSHVPGGGYGQVPATQEGPRINVTRNPMSFTPHGR